MGFFKWLKEVFMGEEQESCDVVPGLTKRIKVKVVMDKDGSCWNYALEADDDPSDPYVKAGNKIDMGSGPGSGADIEFRLQGKAGHQLDFNIGDPIWIKKDDCPTSGTGLPTGFSIVGTTTANKLVIRDQNDNSQEEFYHYRLNFIDRSTTPPQPVSWDPIIRNGGGGP